MAAYYNENDPFCAAWLRNLIAAGLLPEGHVDDRDIRDVLPGDLTGYAQCHFFAGIGGFGYAMRHAGWPDDRPAWTGSCPCQPWSVAGEGLGFADERHLWPAWFRLIRECRPVVLLGEQVSGPGGRAWFDSLCDDLEGAGYAVGAVDLPACSVGAPNIRQRLWWMAHAQGRGFAINGLPGGANSRRQDARQPAPGIEAAAGRLGIAEGIRPPAGTRLAHDGHGQDQSQRPGHDGTLRSWREPRWIACTGGRRRPIPGTAEPGLQRMADGNPGGVAGLCAATGPYGGAYPLARRKPGDVQKLKAYGNSVNFELAATFVRACMDTVDGR